PKPGILFKDITTLLKDGESFRAAVDGLLEKIGTRDVDVVVGMESRGFIFGAPIAYKLGVGFVPVRKLGKLPADVVSVEYDLEYGSATLEMHKDALGPGARVLIVDALLATGHTVGGPSPRASPPPDPAQARAAAASPRPAASPCPRPTVVPRPAQPGLPVASAPPPPLLPAVSANITTVPITRIPIPPIAGKTAS